MDAGSFTFKAHTAAKARMLCVLSSCASAQSARAGTSCSIATAAVLYVAHRHIVVCRSSPGVLGPIGRSSLCQRERVALGKLHQRVVPSA